MASDISERVKSIVTENAQLKLLSLAFALVLYSLVHGASDAQRSVSVNLVMMLPPGTANRILVSQLPPTIRLTLRGPRAVLDDLRNEDLGNVQVDVRTGTEKRVILDPSMVHLPAAVRVEQLDPPVIDLEWEEQVMRDVPVQVSVVGSPANGFTVHGVPVAEPATLRVRGPKTEVQVLQHVRADALDVSGLAGGKYQRHLAVDRPRGRVTTETSSVLVSIDISREVVERNFSKIPVVVVGIPKGRTTPAEVDVRLACPPEIVRSLRPEQIIARVEEKSVAPSGSETVPVLVKLTGCEAHVLPGEVVVRW
ncbi:MAG: CdaR family protein [Polyangiaceae bacterium]